MAMGLGLSMWRGKILSLIDVIKEWKPTDLFGASTNELWLDASDLGTMFKDSTGAKQCRWHGDTVGLILDKSQGLVFGDSTLANGDFSSGQGSWVTTPTRGTYTFSGNSATITDNGTHGNQLFTASLSITVPIAKAGFHRLGLRVLSGSILKIVIGTVSSDQSTGTGDRGAYANLTAGTVDVSIYAVYGTTVQLTDVTMRHLPGNHVTQEEAGSRPRYMTDGKARWIRFDATGTALNLPVRLTAATSVYAKIMRRAGNFTLLYERNKDNAWTFSAADTGSDVELGMTTPSKLSVNGVVTAPRTPQGLLTAVTGSVPLVVGIESINPIEGRFEGRLGLGGYSTAYGLDGRLYALIMTEGGAETEHTLPYLKEGDDEPAPAGFNLMEGIDFREWTQSGVYGMPTVTQNSFTNQATSGISQFIGTEIGKTYRITISASRGAGALRVYFSDSPSINTPAGTTDVPIGENRTVDIVADGPWITFRASVGNTTTVVTKLTVVQI